MNAAAVTIESVEARVYRIPTDQPESDGTIAWNSTTLVLALVNAGGQQGLGYTYAHAAAAALIADPLRDDLVGTDAMDVPAAWTRMNRALRNIGRPGLGLMAISAVDHALWDLKGRLCGRSVVDLLGRARRRVPVYGSGGFTSYTTVQLQQQLSGWAEQGMANVKINVKMKVGRKPSDDPQRVAAARSAIGAQVGLMVDANGAYTRSGLQRRRLARNRGCFDAHGTRSIATNRLVAWSAQTTTGSRDIKSDIHAQQPFRDYRLHQRG